jgi:hypothetical protein
MSDYIFPRENLGSLVHRVRAALQTMTEVLEKRNTQYSPLMFAPVSKNNDLILNQVRKLDIERMIEQTLGQRALV